MSYRLKLTSEKVYFKGEFRELEVGIKGGRIGEVGNNIGPAREVIELGGNLLLPGVIDGHVHFRDPGNPEKENFESGSKAALAGGVTTVVDMPNNNPPIKSRRLFEEKKEVCRRKSLVNFALYSGIPEDLSKIGELWRAGAVGFKHYMATEEVDIPELYREIKKFNALLTVHAELPEKLARGENPQDPRAYLDTRPPEAEIEGVKLLLNGAPERLHLAHATLPESVCRLQGKATVEVTPHHLLLSREDIQLEDFTAVTHPPIRSRESVAELQELLRGDGITIVASDHAPHEEEAKTTSHPRRGSPGIPGVETTLPLLLTFADQRGLPLNVPVDKLTKAPSRLFGFENRGEIREGYWADLVAVDPDTERAINGENFHSKAKVTPFEGRKVSYWPVLTVVNGVPAYRDGRVLLEQRGRFLSHEQ